MCSHVPCYSSQQVLKLPPNKKLRGSYLPAYGVASCHCVFLFPHDKTLFVYLCKNHSKSLEMYKRSRKRSRDRSRESVHSRTKKSKRDKSLLSRSHRARDRSRESSRARSKTSSTRQSPESSSRMESKLDTLIQLLSGSNYLPQQLTPTSNLASEVAAIPDASDPGQNTEVNPENANGTEVEVPNGEFGRKTRKN